LDRKTENVVRADPWDFTLKARSTHLCGFSRSFDLLLLPILCIVAMYYVPTEKVRLGSIVAFSMLCSTILNLLTDAKNVEIIAAAAA
jgi:hypothetical protein